MLGLGQRFGFAEESCSLVEIQAVSVPHSQRHLAPQVNICPCEGWWQIGLEQSQRFSGSALLQENLGLQCAEFPVPVGIQRRPMLENGIGAVERAVKIAAGEKRPSIRVNLWSGKRSIRMAPVDAREKRHVEDDYG